MANYVQTPANVLKVSGSTSKGTAGATIVAGNAVYIDTSDSNLIKAADKNTAAAAVVAGIALHGAFTGQPVEYQRTGSIDLGATLGVGDLVVLSDAGALSAETELAITDFVSLIGIATATDNCEINIVNSGVQR